MRRGDDRRAALIRIGHGDVESVGKTRPLRQSGVYFHLHARPLHHPHWGVGCPPAARGEGRRTRGACPALSCPAYPLQLRIKVVGGEKPQAPVALCWGSHAARAQPRWRNHAPAKIICGERVYWCRAWARRRTMERLFFSCSYECVVWVLRRRGRSGEREKAATDLGVPQRSCHCQEPLSTQYPFQLQMPMRPGSGVEAIPPS